MFVRHIISKVTRTIFAQCTIEAVAQPDSSYVKSCQVIESCNCAEYGIFNSKTIWSD